MLFRSRVSHLLPHVIGELHEEEQATTATHFRVFPGEGAHSAAVADLIRAIDRMGYEGDYSFEVFNDDYTQMQLGRVTDRARRSVAWITGHVSRRSLPVRRTAGA